MKRHPIAVSAVLGILMSLVATASNAAETALVPEFIPNKVADNSTPGTKPLSSAERNVAMPATMTLTAEELISLQNKEAQSPELLKQAAAGCSQVWDPNLGEYRKSCANAVQEGVIGGLIGALIGSLGGAAGAAGGAVVGFVWLYATDGKPFGN